MSKVANFVKVFDARKFFENKRAVSKTMDMNYVQLSESEQDELVSRFELLESLLTRAAPLLERSKRIISDEFPRVPHVIETSLESLRIEIDDALTKIEFK